MQINAGEALLLTTEPASVNVSATGEAVFVCSAEEHTVSSIMWRNISVPVLLSNNASLGITSNISGDSSSSQRTSVLRIEGREEYNETRVQCIASGFTAEGEISSAKSNEATLLVQGKKF